MAELSNISLIEKYVNYELTEAEELLLENRLQTDKDFKTEFELAVFLHAKDRAEQRIHYKNVLENPETKIKASDDKIEIPIIPIENQAKKSKTSGRLNWLKLVAALLIIPTLSILVYQNMYNNLDRTMSKIFAFEKAKPMSISHRSGKLINSNLALAINAYNKKDFHEANQFFKAMESDSTLTIEQSFYYAKSLLFDNSYSDAIGKFKVMIANPDASRFHLDCRWFMALAFIKLDAHNEAKVILNKLSKEGHMVEKTKSLLKKLK